VSGRQHDHDTEPLWPQEVEGKASQDGALDRYHVCGTSLRQAEPPAVPLSPLYFPYPGLYTCHNDHFLLRGGISSDRQVWEDDRERLARGRNGGEGAA
jgi:hypothetical protein